MVAVVFTTTRPRGSRPKARGEIEISAEIAVGLGQSSAFRIDVRRVAAVPLNSDFFPDLDRPDHGILGRSEHLARAAETLLQQIVAETPELVEFLGPSGLRRTLRSQ